MFFFSFTISYSESEYFKQTMRQGGPAKPKEPRIPRMPQLYAPLEAGFLLIVICALLPFILIFLIYLDFLSPDMIFNFSTHKG